MNIGFNFCYFGNVYNKCVISSNNYISFDTTLAGTSSPWSTVAVPTSSPAEVRNSILAPWQDLNPGAGGNIYYQTIGTAPNRAFVVSYVNIPMFSCTGLSYTSQIILRESSNCIETHIASKPLCTSWNSGNAVYALQDATGSSAVVFAGRNNTPWSVTSEGTLWTPTCGTCLTATTCSSPLPIQLVSFNAILNDNHVDLTWTTASEINNDYFIVEKSKDGKIWEQVVWVDGAGNSNYTLNYYEVDEHPYEGVSYYRLKQVDFDGNYSYSNIVPVTYQKEIERGITILPNPVKKGEPIYVEIKGFKGENILLVLRDMKGKEYYTKAQVIESDYLLKALHLDKAIPRGTYLIIASLENNLIAQKIIIE